MLNDTMRSNDPGSSTKTWPGKRGDEGGMFTLKETLEEISETWAKLS